jgi:hypothetical protein
MMNGKLLYQWEQELSRRLPSLNSWQVANIALFSQGVIRAEACQQGHIARQVLCGERIGSAERRLRRFLDNESLAMEGYFEEWTRWVLSAYEGEQITLLVDETKLKDKLAVMVVGLAWQGRCIPLAWRCYRANCGQAYPAEGQVAVIEALLKTVQKALPEQRDVLVLADRGIGTSPALCRAVEQMGWYYLFRVTRQSKICTQTGEYTIAQMVQPGQFWAATGRIFKRRGQIPAYARALWSLPYDEPWALVTNAADCSGIEYAQRNWQEQSFRDLKSQGLHWQHSLIRLPEHMQRLLILLVIAYAYLLALGCHAVRADRAQPLVSRPNGTLRRHWSLFKEGLAFFTEVVYRSTVCPQLSFSVDTRFT